LKYVVFSGALYLFQLFSQIRLFLIIIKLNSWR
jgi:hypothetical protein